MTGSRLILIHVLAADPPDGETIRTRSTIRTGDVEAGQQLWFEGPDRRRGKLTVLSLTPTDRWTTIVFSGRAEDLGRVVTGTYIHGYGIGDAERQEGTLRSA